MLSMVCASESVWAVCVCDVSGVNVCGMWVSVTVVCGVCFWCVCVSVSRAHQPSEQGPLRGHRGEEGRRCGRGAWELSGVLQRCPAGSDLHVAFSPCGQNLLGRTLGGPLRKEGEAIEPLAKHSVDQVTSATGSCLPVVLTSGPPCVLLNGPPTAVGRAQQASGSVRSCGRPQGSRARPALLFCQTRRPLSRDRAAGSSEGGAALAHRAGWAPSHALTLPKATAQAADAGSARGEDPEVLQGCFSAPAFPRLISVPRYFLPNCAVSRAADRP